MSRERCRRPERADDALHRAVEHDRFEIQGRPRSQAGEVEQVLDDRVQAIRLIGHVAQHRRLHGCLEVVRSSLQEPRVPVDRGHRRPKLVRHEPEELVLDRVRGRQGPGGRPRLLLRLVPIADVDQDVHGSHELPIVVEQGRGIGKESHLLAIRADRDGLAPADRALLAKRDGHGALVVAHRAPVREEQFERAAPQLAEHGSAAPEGRRGIVEVGDLARRVGRVHGHAEGVEEPAVAAGRQEAIGVDRLRMAFGSAMPGHRSRRSGGHGISGGCLRGRAHCTEQPAACLALGPTCNEADTRRRLNRASIAGCAGRSDRAGPGSRPGPWGRRRRAAGPARAAGSPRRGPSPSDGWPRRSAS